MLSASQITKELGGRIVLAGISLTVKAGDVLGVVGANGSGKTTLLRVLAGDLLPDSGHVEFAAGLRRGYLPQGRAAEGARTAGELFPAIFEPGEPGVLLERVAARLAEATDPRVTADLERRYDALLTEVAEGRDAGLVDAGRAALGLRPLDAWIPAAQLSGGELAKLGLLNLAASQPGALLLDEPTNHLDLAGIAWVQSYIERFRGPVVVVSHDRALLDACAGEILELDAQTHRADLFTGGYSDFAAEKSRRKEALWEQYRRQERDERKLRRTIAAIEARSRAIEDRTINFYFRKRAAKVARRSVTLKARLERHAESSQHVGRPAKGAHGFYGRFQADAASASRLLTADTLSLAIGGRALFSGLTFQALRGERVVVVGANGSGKTTLLRAIMGEQPVAAGRLDLSGSATIGYLPQDDDTAWPVAEPALTAVESLRRTRPMPEAEAYNFLHRFLFGADLARTPVAQLSYGERRRLALARLVLGGANLLLLDEPTNHLDVPSREAFEHALAAFDGTAIVVTHDRYFIERFADVVVDIG